MLLLVTCSSSTGTEQASHVHTGIPPLTSPSVNRADPRPASVAFFGANRSHFIVRAPMAFITRNVYLQLPLQIWYHRGRGESIKSWRRAIARSLCWYKHDGSDKMALSGQACALCTPRGTST